MEKKRERFLEWATQNSSSEAHTFLSLIASNKILLARSNLLTELAFAITPGRRYLTQIARYEEIIGMKSREKLKLTAPFMVWNVKRRLLISARWTLLQKIVFHLGFWTKIIHFYAPSAFNWF